MMHMDIWNAAGEMEADALRRPSWVTPTRVPGPRTDHVARVRRVLGRALIDLGRIVAAEQPTNTAPRLG
jgi:hypothetical protein